MADSGERRVHAFCENCGSPAYSAAVESPQKYTLRVGALKQRHKLGRPVREIWTRRRFTWLPAIEQVEAFDGQP